MPGRGGGPAPVRGQLVEVPDDESDFLVLDDESEVLVSDDEDPESDEDDDDSDADVEERFPDLPDDRLSVL